MNRRGPLEVIGHGGADGFFPSNSTTSILKAVQIGVDRIEIDVIGTLGRDLVLMHDEEVLHQEILRPVVTLMVNHLRTIEPDLLTLNDAFEITANDVPLMLDIKCRGFEQELIEAISTLRATAEVSISSTHGRTLRKISRAFPGMRVGLSRGHALTKLHRPILQRIAGAVLGVAQIVPLIAWGRFCGATEAMVNHHICTRPLIVSLHWAGLRVYPWTANHVVDIERLIDDGVDGIISSRPDLVIETMKRLGVPRL